MDVLNFLNYAILCFLHIIQRFLLLEKILLGRCCISLVKLIVMRKADFIWGNYFLFIIRIYGTLTKDSSDALMSKASGAKLGLMNKKRPGTLKIRIPRRLLYIE